MPPRAKRKRASHPTSPADSPAARRRTERTENEDGEQQEAPVLVPVKGERLPAAFAAHRQQRLLFDATLVVGDTRVEAHKIVLITYSPYLKGLFTSGLAESSQSAASGPVEIHSVDGEAVAACVDCMYSGAIALTGATVCAVLRAANMLRITPIEQASCDFFVGRLEPETALDALGFAEDMATGGTHGQDLHSQVVAYVYEHFTECAATPAFVRLASSSVAALIGSDELRVRSEEVVLSALRRWYEHDVEGRVSALQTLVPLVRFPLLPMEVQLQLGTELLLEAAAGGKLGSTTTNQLCVECLPAFRASAAAVDCPRLKRRKGSGQVFTFASVDNTNAIDAGGDDSGGRFDEAGVLHHIATEGGTSAYVNPHEAGRVVATRSGGEGGRDQDFVAGTCPRTCFTHSGPNQWMAVDLGTGRQLTVNHYALRYGGMLGRSALRNWELQGSEDGVTWTTLRRHDDDPTMEERGRVVAHWAVEGVTASFRHFRVHQHGPNAKGLRAYKGHALYCNGIELYGTLTEA